MKSFENKETTIISADENGNKIGNTKYSDLILLMMRQPKTGGYSFTDIEQRIAITKALKDCNGAIELEDEQFKYMKKLLEASTWPFYHEDLLSFKEDVMAAK